MKTTSMLAGLLCCVTILPAQTVINPGEKVVVEGEFKGPYQLNGGELVIRDIPADLRQIELNSGTLQVDRGFNIQSLDEFPLRIQPGLTIEMGLWDMTDWGLDTVAILEGGAIEMRWCTIAAEQVVVCSQETSEPIIVHNCFFGRAQQAVFDLKEGDLLLDSCLFVTNNVVVQAFDNSQIQIQNSQFMESSQAVTAYSPGAVIEISNCDFLGNTLHDVNCQAGSATLTGCFRDGAADLVGDVIENDPLPQQLGEDPPPPADTPADLNIPDLLSWEEVTKTVQDKPIRVVEYRIYRSDDPYNVYAPENLIEVTAQTWFQDPELEQLDKAFYRVVAVSGP